MWARNGRISVHGHRGARARFPENSIPGFLHAIEAGADFIELDVLATADDVLVACHDPILRRRVFRGPRENRIIRRMTREELRAWECGARRNPRFRRQQTLAGLRIPTLEEVFALAGCGHFGFNIEVKSSPLRAALFAEPERCASLLIDLIRRHRVERRVMVQSFDFRVLRAVRALAPSLPISGLCGLKVRNFVALAGAAGASVIGPYHRLVTGRRVAAAHAAGIRVVPWTVNRRRDWDRLVRAGVDGIITDDPAALIAHLRETRSTGR